MKKEVTPITLKWTGTDTDTILSWDILVVTECYYLDSFGKYCFNAYVNYS